MMTLSLASRRAVAVTGAGIVGFAAALAAASQIAVPLPGTPVPLTLQPLLVVLAGLCLGPRAGAASMTLYLAAGALGLPVFSPFGAPGVARIAGPTGGYLLAYPAAAFAAGWLASRAASLPGRIASAAAGILVLYVGGVAWLAAQQQDAVRALVLGVQPFVAIDLAKAVVAGLLAPRARPR